MPSDRPPAWARMATLAAALLAGPAQGADAGAAADDEPMHWTFVVGRYELIGRHPDSRRTYTGHAEIDRVGQRLRLRRTIAGRQTEIFGVVRRADPGEAWVLSFAWGVKPVREMVCLVGSDLDNYARLTCHWGLAGNPHQRPGMEAYFAREPWEPLRD